MMDEINAWFAQRTKNQLVKDTVEWRWNVM
jgi:hypothetical protein